MLEGLSPPDQILLTSQGLLFQKVFPDLLPEFTLLPLCTLDSSWLVLLLYMYLILPCMLVLCFNACFTPLKY